MSDTKLNEDIYSHLLSFISSPVDLLAVSLANKELHSLAEPELIYRSIRCRLGNNTVWEHLIANPSHASRVREIEIQRENFSGLGPLDERERFAGNIPDMLPTTEELVARQSPDRQQIEASEHLLIEAIRVMVNLESFIWDRWVPVVNFGDEVPQLETGHVEDGTTVVLKTYQKDIWTALRNHTQIRRLKVVDLGSHQAIVPNPHRIFDSTIFTLRNLTHVNLKIYSPADEDDGFGGDGDELLPGRVNISRLQEFLLQCPNLQRLTLAILDRFFLNFGGNPFTDISSLLSAARWPDLSHLNLSDVLVNTEAMTNFVNNHPNIRTITSFLSLLDDDLPEVPFSLDTAALRSDALSNLETLHLSPAPLRRFLKAVKRPLAIRDLRTLQPCDWDAAEDEEDDYDSSFDDMWVEPPVANNQISEDEDGEASLDDTWGEPPAAKKQTSEDEDNVSRENLLEGFSNLRSLEVRDVESIAQLEKLANVTPDLEVLRITAHHFRARYNHSTPYRELLPYLSMWPHLVCFRTIGLWPRAFDSSELSSEVISETVNEIIAACPSLREISWTEGSMAKLVKSENGSVKLELEDREKTAQEAQKASY